MASGVARRTEQGKQRVKAFGFKFSEENAEEREIRKNDQVAQLC